MEKCKSVDLLKSHKLKATKQRIELLDTILNLKKRVFSPKELTSPSGLTMDQATIYRILSQLKTNGIIREVLTSHDDKRYEISCIHNPVHPHLHCQKCYEIICLDQLSENSINLLKNLYKEIEIDKISITLEGICENCSSKQN